MKRLELTQPQLVNRDQIAKELGDRFFGSLREICSKYPVEHHILMYRFDNNYTLYNLEFWLHGKAIAKFRLHKWYRPTVDKTYYDTARRIIGKIYVPEFKVGDIIIFKK